MIKIASAKGFSPTELTQLQNGVDLANAVMASDIFRQTVMAFEFDSTDDTSFEIYAKLTHVDYCVDFSIQSYPWWNFGKRKEVAHENPDGSVVLNRRFFDTQSVPSIADTVGHETSHKAGYGHSSAQDYASVPYGVGYMIEAIAKKGNFHFASSLQAAPPVSQLQPTT